MSKILVKIIFMILFSLAMISGQKIIICDYCAKKITAKYFLTGKNSYHNICYEKSVQIKCGHCHEKILKDYVTYENINYHNICYEKFIQLKCDFCFLVIENSYSFEKDKKYHKKCFVNNILDKCDICLKPLEGKFIVDYWDNKYHEKHQIEMPVCDSCSRIVSQELTGGGYLINKKRSICSLCIRMVVNKKNQIPNLSEEVRNSLELNGLINLPKVVPISLVDSKNELIKLSKNKLGNIKGYTHYNKTTLGGVTIKEDFHIYILSNLHSTAFKAVLAHEYLHVYLFMNNYYLNSDITEGFCNLGSQLIFQNIDTELSKYYLKSMYQNNDPDYGKGFIKMNSILERTGWKKLLDELMYIN